MSEQIQRIAAEKSASTPTVALLARSAPKCAASGEAAADLSTPVNMPALPGHSLSRIGIHYGAPAPIQAKLTVGPVNDQYEQEADSVAQRVVEQINRPVAQRQELPKEDEDKAQTKPLISSLQRQETPEDEDKLQTRSLVDSIQRQEQPEDEDKLQTKSLVNSIQRQETPKEDEEKLQTKPLASAIQRQEGPEDEEKLQTKALGAAIQRQEQSDEEEKLQTKPLGNVLQRQEMPEDEEKVQTKSLTATVQRQVMPEDEEKLQTKAADNTLQRQEDQDDEILQSKPQIQRRADGSMAATPALESAIQQSRGSGQALSESTRGSMERAFGVDFSQVKVHTDARADHLNRSIQARAFTTGQDIYFRQGEHSPGTRAGQELLAHELTHVVQQTDARVQRKDNILSQPSGAIWKKSMLSSVRPCGSKSARSSKIGLSGLIQTATILPPDRIIQRTLLYRGMQASTPGALTSLLGNDAGYQLGVRDGEVTIENEQAVPGTGGMSTSNSAAAVPAFTVSKAYTGGSHNTTAQATQAFRWKWEFDDANLPDELTTRNDHGNHVMIEPKNKMLLSRFRELVQSTQANWGRKAPP